MKKLFLFIISILFSQMAMCQNNAIVIKNLKTNKEKVIKENKLEKSSNYKG